MFLQTRSSHFFLQTCLKSVIFTFIPCVLCTWIEALFSELIFFAAVHLFSICTASLYLYISWSSQCPKKLEKIGKTVRTVYIYWAGENIPNGKYDRFPLGQNFLPVTFLFLLQPIANSRAGIYRSKRKKKRDDNVKVRTKGNERKRTLA